METGKRYICLYAASYYRVSFMGVIYVELLTPDMHVYISFFAILDAENRDEAP